MGVLYDIRLKIDEICQQKHLDPLRTKGMIGMKAGLMLGLVDETTPDTKEGIQKLKQAVKDVLQVEL